MLLSLTYVKNYASAFIVLDVSNDLNSRSPLYYPTSRSFIGPLLIISPGAVLTVVSQFIDAFLTRP